MRLPFTIGAVTAAVGLTGLIVAGVSRGPAADADGVGAPTLAPPAAPATRLLDAGRLARSLDARPPAVAWRRDPFKFAGAQPRDKTAGRAVPLPFAEASMPEPSAPARPVLQLLGIAEDAAGDGTAVRTAIIGGLNQVFLVKAGEQIALRFLVREIGRDVVAVEDLTDGTVLRLPLR